MRQHFCGFNVSAFDQDCFTARGKFPIHDLEYYARPLQSAKPRFRPTPETRWFASRCPKTTCHTKGKSMRMTTKIAAAVLLIGATGPAIAMPIATSPALGIENADTSLVQEARVVCDSRGCMRVGPRRFGRSFGFAPRRFRRDWRSRRAVNLPGRI